QRDSQALTATLYVFGIPLFVLVLVFIILVSGLSAAGQRNEIAVLRSRGASAWQIALITFLGICGLAALALLAGAPAAMGLVQFIGQARSFLSFEPGPALPVAMTPQTLPFGLLTLAITALI